MLREIRSKEGQDAPDIHVLPPGPKSTSWMARFGACHAPMGLRPHSRSPLQSIVLAEALGANLFDVDGNRYVDLAAGFGALLLGHSDPRLISAVETQASRLTQALGDVYPSDTKIRCAEQLVALYPCEQAQVIFGQSGADAVTAALKTATLATGRSGWVAFRGAYHGLSYAPLAACGLRDGYRTPFAQQLNPGVSLVDYPSTPRGAERTLEDISRTLERGDVGAVLIEPIQGRGGCVLPPAGFFAKLRSVCHRHGALVIADEIWTGLGRSGHWLHSAQDGECADLICLGKGLGGGFPISACLGRGDVMRHWTRDEEVVHTSTYAGAPFACAAALATLSALREDGLVDRSARAGRKWRDLIAESVLGCRGVEDVRGSGLMVAVDLGPRPGAALRLQRELLCRGYVTSTGGGQREVLILTPPLNTDWELLAGMVAPLATSLHALAL